VVADGWVEVVLTPGGVKQAQERGQEGGVNPAPTMWYS
jgi:hypothetical protein